MSTKDKKSSTTFYLKDNSQTPFKISGSDCLIDLDNNPTSPVWQVDSPPPSATSLEQSWEVLRRHKNVSKDMIPNFNTQSLTETEFVPTSSIMSTRMSSVGNRVDKPLCGFLLKMGNRGLLKLKRERWFKYNPDTGRLCYYRHASDYMPLGSIPISQATFTYNVEHIEKCQFQINISDRTYELQAKCEQEMMDWLRELQAKRKEFISQENTMLTETMRILEDEANPAPEEKPNGELSSPTKTYGKNSLPQKQSEKHQSMYDDTNSGIWNKIKPSNKSVTMVRANSSSNSNYVKKEGFCEKCLEYQKTITSLEGDNDNISQQLEDKCQVIRTLQSAVRSLDIQYRSYCNLVEDNKEKGSEHRRKRINWEPNDEHSKIIQDLNLEIDNLKDEKSTSDLENQELKDRLQTLEEILSAKENVVISLTKHIYSLEHTGERPPGDAVLLNRETTLKERLHDVTQQMNAYKTNTEFMKREVDDLLSLQKQKEENLDLLRDQYSNLEAEHEKLRGKYLILLKELSKPTASNFLDSELLDNMLKEALYPDRIRTATISAHDHMDTQDYDLYGFAYFDFDLTPEQKEFLIKAYLQSLHDNKDETALHTEKWNSYVHRTGRRDHFVNNRELKELIRFGIPQPFRKELWKNMIQKLILKTQIDLDESYYKNVIELAQGQTAAVKQVQLDLLRTLPNNKHFKREGSEGINKLNRILLAYSYHNPRIGYCQGINRIAAILLLLLDEFDAFLGMVAIIDVIMPQDYYSNKLLDSQADQRVFNDLLSEKIPRLYSFLQREKLDISLITFNWFFTVFVDSFPPDVMLLIWDCFLSEGSKILFRFALAFFKMHEEKLLQFSPTNYFKLVKELSESTFDSRRLCHTAFYGMNPLSTRDINRKRQFHRSELRQEFREMDERRESAMRALKERESAVVRMSEIDLAEEVYNSD